MSWNTLRTIAVLYGRPLACLTQAAFSSLRLRTAVCSRGLTSLNLKLQLPTFYRLFSYLTRAQSHSLRQQFRQVGGASSGADLSVILRERKDELRHRHYSVMRLRRLLVGFKVERIRRTGLLLFPVMHILGVFISKAFGFHVRVFMEIAALEDGIEFGPLAYNLSVLAVKSSSVQ